MPFYLRRIEPVNIGRYYEGEGKIGTQSLGSHEEAVHRMLVNLIRQLGSLGSHATDIFSKKKL